MVDTNLKQTLNEKIQGGEFSIQDIPAYLELFCQLGNEISDLQDEVDGWNRKIQFQMDGLGKYWIAINAGQFTYGAGMLADPGLTLTLSADEAAQIFAGDKDAKAAYMSGALKVQGELPDAVKLQSLIGIVCEEIEY